MKNYTNALKYQTEALKISEELKNKNSIGINMGNIGETYFAIAKAGIDTANRQNSKPGSEAALDKAIGYLENAVAILKETNYAAPMIEFMEYLSRAYFLGGDYKKAFRNLKQATAIKDSVFSLQNKVALSNLETRRELDLKDKDIIIKNKQIEIGRLEVENQRKERAIFIAGMVLLALVGGAVIFKFFRRARMQKNTLVEIAQIQSHDVRGPVSKILGLSQLFNHEDAADPVNKEVIKHITDATHEIDEIINIVVSKAHKNRRRKG
jgi:signal transduction histidine kinase